LRQTEEIKVVSYQSGKAGRWRRCPPCFTLSNLAAAAALGFLVGLALASTVFAHRLADDGEVVLTPEPPGRVAGPRHDPEEARTTPAGRRPSGGAR